MRLTPLGWVEIVTRTRKHAVTIALFGILLAIACGPADAQAPPAGAARQGNGRDQIDASTRFRGTGVQTLDDLRSLVIEGPADSVESLARVIEEIDRLSIGSGADIQVVMLEYSDPESMAAALREIYTSRETARLQIQRNRGQVAFVPIAQPNAIVVIAPVAELPDVVTFVQELDKNSKTAGRQFRVFRLSMAPAASVRDKLNSFFAGREDDAGLRVRVEVVSDDRTNSLIVYAGPHDLQQAALLIEQLDNNENDAVNELRIFPLRNAQAAVLAQLLNQAIAQRSQAAGTTAMPAAAPGRPGVPAAPAPTTGTGLKAAKLKLVSTDAQGRAVESGILEDITVTSDTRTNALVVTAPASSMSLVAELIGQLDRGPGSTQGVRVFMLRGSNAEELLQTLQQIFLGTSTSANIGRGTTTGGGPATATGQPTVTQPTATQTPTTSAGTGATAGAIASLPVRFTPNFRTNSIIVTGSEEDLRRVEEIILKLDEPEGLRRDTIVYNLNNLTATEAVDALNLYLAEERLQDQISVISVSADRAQQDQSQEVVASGTATQPTAERTPLEPQTNTIIITASPGFLEPFLQVVADIDRRPPQVVIQVLIAQIELNNHEELGLEVGFQNDTLFDRSLIVGNQGPGRDTLVPGYNFNTTAPLQSPLGSAEDPIGLQGLSNFALGRGSPLGYGGLIFAVSSDNVSILLRALKRQRRLDVLSRPQVMTLDNQQASIQIGQRIRVPTGSVTSAQGGTTSTFQAENIGIILAVTPRIGPDGRILMRVAPQISSLARDSTGAIEGLPIGVTEDQTVIETPIINITQAVTTVSSDNGETVVIGGLITKESAIEERKVPFLGDIPYAEWLFKTRLRSVQKRELLIILTPHVVYNDFDAARIKQIESCRIDWIMSDVEEVHGDIGVDCGREDENCKNGKHAHKRSEFGPVLNFPTSGRLPRNIPAHKRTNTAPHSSVIDETPMEQIPVEEYSEPAPPIEMPVEPEEIMVPNSVAPNGGADKKAPMNEAERVPIAKSIKEVESKAPARAAINSVSGRPPESKPPRGLLQSVVPRPKEASR